MNDKAHEYSEYAPSASEFSTSHFNADVNSTCGDSESSGNKRNDNSSGPDIQLDLGYFTNPNPRGADLTQSESRDIRGYGESPSNNNFSSPSKPMSAPEGNDSSSHSGRPQQPTSSASLPQALAYQSAAAVPIELAVHPIEDACVNVHQPVGASNQSLSNSGPDASTAVGAASTSALAPIQPILRDGDKPKPRCFEEGFAVIVQRSTSVASKSSNTTYRCKFCNFTFVGGPQKIRVHLTGKRENGTRLSRCEHCPEDVRKQLEEKMRKPRETTNDTEVSVGPDASTSSLPRRNDEEYHCIVLSRSENSNSKSSNTRYKCIYCPFRFVGGPQKIRVHITGLPEGGTRIAKCPRAPPDAVAQMTHRRRKSQNTNQQASNAHGEAASAAQSSLPVSHAVSSAGNPAQQTAGQPLLSLLQTHQNLLQQSIQKQQQLHQSQADAQQFHNIQQHQQQLAHFQRQQQQQQQQQMHEQQHHQHQTDQ